MTSSRRIPVVGGNWKMNTTLPEAVELARELTERLSPSVRPKVIIFPPFTNLEAVFRVIDGSTLELGAQDLFYEAKGAVTGEISAEMILSVGVTWALVGHSERRRLLGESNEVVNRKLRRALESGLRVTLAIGETEAERQRGATEAVLDEQLSGSLVDVDDEALSRIIVAYEPVWAIGTGLTATPDQAQETHSFIRSWFARSFSEDTAGALRIQYGGSVTAANSAELMSMPDIDGALVGGASLKAGDFAAIVAAAGAA